MYQPDTVYSTAKRLTLQVALYIAGLFGMFTGCATTAPAEKATGNPVVYCSDATPDLDTCVDHKFTVWQGWTWRWNRLQCRTGGYCQGGGAN